MATAAVQTEADGGQDEGGSSQDVNNTTDVFYK